MALGDTKTLCECAEAHVVRSLPLFCGMEEQHFKSLMGASHVQRFNARAVLFREGERPDFLHVLLLGAVEFFCASRTRETTLSYLRAPTGVIVGAVILDQPLAKSARTLKKGAAVLIRAVAADMARTSLLAGTGALLV